MNKIKSSKSAMLFLRENWKFEASEYPGLLNLTATRKMAYCTNHCLLHLLNHYFNFMCCMQDISYRNNFSKVELEVITVKTLMNILRMGDLVGLKKLKQRQVLAPVFTEELLRDISKLSKVLEKFDHNSTELKNQEIRECVRRLWDNALYLLYDQANTETPLAELLSKIPLYMKK